MVQQYAALRWCKRALLPPPRQPRCRARLLPGRRGGASRVYALTAEIIRVNVNRSDHDGGRVAGRARRAVRCCSSHGCLLGGALGALRR
eukprot:scaffold23597_cov29-Tisochrysis_lutea.AAC.3